MKTFAIRQAGTDLYMPGKRAGKVGFSNDMPVKNGGEFGPRLLHSRASATRAISNWKQGAWHLDRSGGYDDYEEELTVIEKPERATIELVVVEFDLFETVKL